MADKLEPQKVLEAIENCSVEDQQVVLQYAYETIKQLMTDSVTVVHGHWTLGKCSKCNGHAPFWSMATTYYRSNYCPHCGAKMDERCSDSDAAD